MDRKELETKDKKDLMAVGEALGFKITPAMTKADMIEMLTGGDAKTPAVAAPEAEAAEGALPAEGALRDLQGNKVTCRQFRVTIQATDQDRDPAKLSVNGHMMLVRRGVEVVLAEPYVEVLKAAVIDTVEKDPETGKVQRVTIQRYPFMAMPV